MTQTEDDVAFAAEFALGTLAADERAQAETRLAVDADFRRSVHEWEAKLGTLTEMVGPIEPSSEVWPRIIETVRGQRLATASPAVQMSAGAAAPFPHQGASNVVALAPPPAASPRLGMWRGLALGSSALAASLAALVVVQTYRPDLAPWLSRRAAPPKQVAQTTPPPASASGQYVALLQKENEPPAFIMTVNARTRSFTVRRLGDPAETGKSYELWIISDRLQRPRSLGLIGGNEFTTRAALSAYDTDVVNKATYAVTLEPEGGAPGGIASGPVMFTGKLIEVVPAQSRT
jgi:anti-sigma-K factor RskA